MAVRFIRVNEGGFFSRGVDFLRRQKQPFKINMLRASLQYFLITLVVYYQSIYITTLGASPVQLGLAVGIGGIAGAAIAVPAGWMADRYGVRYVFLVGTFIMAFGAIVLAIASDWIVAIPGLFLSILGLTLVETACPLVCGICLKNKERGMGMQLCDTISAIPRLAAPITGAVLVTWFGGISSSGIRPLFLVQFLGFSFIFILIYSRFTNPFETRTTQRGIRLKEDYGEVFRRGRMVKRWIVYRALSSFAYFIGFQAGFVALYANVVKHADQYVLGIMGSAFMIVPITLSIVLGRLADIFGRKRILFATIPVYCLSLSLLIIAPDARILILSSLMQGLLLVNLTNEETISVELVPVNLLGRWSGLLSLTRGMIGILAPVVAGQLWEIVGPSSLFIFLIVVELALIPLLMGMPETLNITPSET